MKVNSRIAFAHGKKQWLTDLHRRTRKKTMAHGFSRDKTDKEHK